MLGGGGGWTGWKRMPVERMWGWGVGDWMLVEDVGWVGGGGGGGTGWKRIKGCLLRGCLFQCRGTWGGGGGAVERMWGWGWADYREDGGVL